MKVNCTMILKNFQLITGALMAIVEQITKASSWVVFDGEDRDLKQEVLKLDDATGEWVTTLEDSTPTRSTLKIPKEGLSVVSVRSESLPAFLCRRRFPY